MRTHARLVLGSLAATILLGALVSTASARRFEISNQGIRATFPALRFAERIAPGGPEVICPVTIEGTFHSRTIAKEPERLIGYITRAILNEPRCAFVEPINGVEIIQSSLPWHIRYESFIGALPNIEIINLRLILVYFILETPFELCHYRSSVAQPAKGGVQRNLATKQATSLIANNTLAIPRIAGNALACPGSGIFEGSAALRLLGSTTTLIFVQLI